MKRNKTGVMPNITREVYKKVKHFDRVQLTNFCKDLYTFGFEDGQKSVAGVDDEELYKVIAETKGIGPKTLEELKANINAAFAEKQTEKGATA